MTAVGPGAFTVPSAQAEPRISIRLDRQGARLASVGVLTVEEKRYCMACLDLTARSVLVVGARRRRAREGARAPRCRRHHDRGRTPVVAELEALPIEIVRRTYRPTDLDSRFLVMVATSTPSVNRRVYERTNARSSTTSSTAELYGFILPAVHRQDPIASQSRPVALRPRSPSGCVTRSRR